VISPLFRFPTPVSHLYADFSFLLFSHPVHLFFVSFRPLCCAFPSCGEFRKAADQISAGTLSPSVLQTVVGAEDLEVTGRCTYAWPIVLSRVLELVYSFVPLSVLLSLGNCEYIVNERSFSWDRRWVREVQSAVQVRYRMLYVARWRVAFWAP
jgi:hypothetical protein